MKIAKFQYKCRLCGEIYTSGETCEDIARTCLICVTLDIDPTKALGHIGTPPSMVETHTACKKGFGIADLIGYIVE